MARSDMTSASPGSHPAWLAKHPLRIWRLENGLSMREAAERLNYSMDTIQFWETGRRWPYITALARLTVALNDPDLVVKWAAWWTSDPRRESEAER